MALVEDVAARLRTQVTGRRVFEYAVPDGPLPGAYLLVRGGVERESSERMTGTTHVGEAIVRVLSIADHADPHVAARTADAGATFARNALRDFRPSSGQWPLRLVAGSDPYRNEAVSATTFHVALQYALRTDL